MYIPSGGTSFWEAITNGIKAVASAQELLNVTHSSAKTYLKGADASGDDLLIYSNRTDDYPRIDMQGNANFYFRIPVGYVFGFYAATTELFRFSHSGNKPQIQFREAASNPTGVTDFGSLFTKSDNKLYFIDGSGAVHEVAFV